MHGKFKGLTLLLSLFIGCAGKPDSTRERSARAVFQAAPQSALKGDASFEFKQNTLTMKVRFEGLLPGSEHGMHVHETGSCQGPDFKSAGDHFNPHKAAHGGPQSKRRHLGDFGNLTADFSGTVEQEISIKGLTAQDLESLRGKSLLLHAKADDLKTQPSGDSGGRIACGIIE
ncbi:MAG TPA: superoxide dismutase family protein [Bacteriovoracaceae bacterium]|nr:superoxide dismutase family protein [Bacteriovoracaceae bacterium]